MKLPSSHTTVEHEYTVKQLCTPLQQFGISFFCHARFYSDNTVKLLSNNSRLYQHFFDKEYLLTTPIPKAHLRKSFYYLVTGDAYQRPMHDTYQIIDANCMIDLISFHEDYYEMLCFAGNMSFNDLISKIGLLYQFGYCFKEQSATLFKEHTDSIVLPAKMQSSLLDDYHCTTLAAAPADVPAKFHINENVALSTREMECCLLLAQGYEFKGIGNILGISPRTVEAHVNNAKLKLSVRRKHDLIQKIHMIPGVTHLHDMLVAS